MCGAGPRYPPVQGGPGEATPPPSRGPRRHPSGVVPWMSLAGRQGGEGTPRVVSLLDLARCAGRGPGPHPGASRPRPPRLAQATVAVLVVIVCLLEAYELDTAAPPRPARASAGHHRPYHHIGKEPGGRARGGAGWSPRRQPAGGGDTRISHGSRGREGGIRWGQARPRHSGGLRDISATGVRSLAVAASAATRPSGTEPWSRRCFSRPFRFVKV